MIVYQEYFVTSFVTRGLAHVRLTEQALTVSLFLMRWVIVPVPVPAMIDARLYRDVFGRECDCMVTYYNRDGLYRDVLFSTRHARLWRDAFCHIGVPIAPTR